VLCQEEFNDPEPKVHTIFKSPDTITNSLPLQILPIGLTSARKKYLFKKIREFVIGDEEKERLCPNPGLKMDDENMEDQQLEQNPPVPGSSSMKRKKAR